MALSSQIVHQRLRATAQKFRWSRSARFLISGAALSLLFLVLFLTFDAWLHFGAAGRWTGFALTVSALVGGTALAVRSFRPQISDASMARRIEQSSGVKGNVLINAVQFDGALAAGSPLRAALFNEMSDPFPGVQWDRVFDVKLLKHLAMGLGAVCVILFGWAMLKPNYFANSVQRIFLPASNIAPLTRTKIEGVVPGSATVVHGREVQMTAMLGGEVPKMAWVHFRESGSSWQKTLMDREAGQTAVNFKWKDVRSPMDYYIEAGDAATATYHLDVRPKTAIKARTAEIEPPAYTGLPKTQIKDLSLLQNIIPGSTVTMGLEFNNEISELKVTDEKSEALAVEKAGEGWKVSAKMVASRSLKLEYRDAVGIADSGTMQVSVKADEPPKVAVSDPVEGKDLVATKTAKLSVKFSATDNFGLGSVAIYQSTDGKDDAKLVQEFAAAKNQKTYEATAEIPLAAFAGDEDRVTFRIVAKDLNDVTGPGVTMSRPIIVTLKSADKLEQQVNEAVSKLTKGIEALIKLQSQNLDETRSASIRKDANPLTSLVERQVAVADGAKQLVAAADVIAPDVRNDLRSMLAKEMTTAVVSLRNAGAVTDGARAKFFATAIANEAMILARLQGAPAAAEADAKRGEIADLISGVEDLLKQERTLHKETSTATEAAAAKLGERQDKLADKAVIVKKSVDTDSKNASVGDVDFRKRLAKVVTMFGEMKVYEEMLAAAEQLQGKKVQPAAATQHHVVESLAKMVELLNQWQLAEAGEKADELKKDVKDIQQKLQKLADIQREILEKTKDMARKDDFRKEDIATAKELKDQKDLMKDVVEKMTTDLQALPELTPGNQMKSELVSIMEDVQQTDLDDIAKGKLKPSEVAVQKEQGLLDAIAAAEKLSADMEMWLPNKADNTVKWDLENFDKTEMPNIPNVPLMDATEDIVGDLQKKQEDIQDQIQDANSNQLFAQNPANGWEIADGPQGSFGAQGKSGNQAPKHNEQDGRSSGGREGESNGEMAGDTASNLEGDTPEARRTKDQLQQGQVKDDGAIGKTRATGGGKAGGFSDRQGMEGNAPLRATKGPKTEVQNAAAVQQALLAEKTAKTVAQASLLYIHSDGLSQVAKLMDESAVAMKEGRMKDAQSLHQKIVGRLKELKSGVNTGEVVSFSSQDGGRTTEKQLLGGSEGDAPAQYKDQVSEYFRSLVEEK